MTITATRTIADRIALTLDGLCRAVAARILGRRMAEAMILLVWQRIRRTDGRLQGLLRRFREGRLQVRTMVRSGGGGVRGERGSPVLPRSFGWLLPMVPCEAACFAGQLRGALAEPEMVALLTVAPQARRVLAPLCRMLAIEKALLTPGRATAPSEGVTDPGPAAGAEGRSELLSQTRSLGADMTPDPGREPGIRSARAPTRSESSVGSGWDRGSAPEPRPPPHARR